jgi:membrane-bound lytic murein transglycosylase B
MVCTLLFPGRLIARLWLILALAVVPDVARAAGDSATTGGFQSFVEDLWPQVQSRGVSRATFEAAFAGLVPDPRIIAATRRQPEYGKPLEVYINSFAGPARIAAGQRSATRWNDTLAAVERAYGIDRFTILSIWGAESDYGAEKPQ